MDWGRQEGENNNRTRLREKDVRAICESLEKDIKTSLAKIAAKHKVSINVVRQICEMVNWKRISVDYDFSKRLDNRFNKPTPCKVYKKL